MDDQKNRNQIKRLDAASRVVSLLKDRGFDAYEALAVLQHVQGHLIATQVPPADRGGVTQRIVASLHLYVQLYVNRESVIPH